MSDEEPEGYTGPAEVVTDAGEIAVHAVLGARFEPLLGRVAWYGRVEGAGDALTGNTPVRVRTPHGEGDATITERDLWGHWHLKSTSEPPFGVEILEVTDIAQL